MVAAGRNVGRPMGWPLRGLGGRCQRGSWDPAGALVEQHTTKSDRRATIAARYRSCGTRGGRWMPGPQAIGRGVHAALSHCSGVGDAPMSQKVEAAASAPAEDIPEVQVLVHEQGREVYDQLTPRERAR